MNDAQQFIFISRYARWIEEEGRRENSWQETTGRYFGFFKNKLGDKVPNKIWNLTEKYVNEMGVMPSMRSIWGAGKALEGNHIIGYNCCYLPFVDLRAPVELFYILMCGTGVGFSVEKQYIDQIPAVPQQTAMGYGVHVVEDSREGWATSLDAQLKAYWQGQDIQFDYSKIRPRGARLKTMGGRASGPEPLIRLHDFVRDMVFKAQGRKLTSLEWLDIGNVIGDVVVVGGVRRSSEINFSDLDDELIRHAKEGVNFPPYRYNSNNSAVYHWKPDAITFMKEWAALAASGRGERGFFNLKAIESHFPARRKWNSNIRTNPCGEILLRPFQFCNLTEVVVRDTDDFDALVNKVKAAVWLGAMQSTLTDFKFIRAQFKINCEEERLLGVSLTGQMDNPALMSAEKLEILKKYAIKETKKACAALGINMSASITCGKPSGTVSQLLNCASGCHPRYSKYYIRRYRIAATDPLFKMMKDQGVEFTPENGQTPENAYTWVCSFPVKSPDNCITREDVDAIGQLEWYLKVQDSWCEHNQSITIYVKDEEWLRVGAWVYDNFDKISAVSFLPWDNGQYSQPPFQEISKQEYEKLVKKFPKIDYTKLSQYEMEDNTEGSKTLACQGGYCEIV